MLLGLLGLVYFRPNAPRIFYPTHLLVDLCIDAPSSSPVAPLAGSAGRPGAGASGDTEAEATDGRCIMVETNYRIYAYTSSVLQEQILRLFVQMLYKMPHMLIGVITRKSVRNALVNGITARQIIEYLHLHAHPQVI